MKKSELSSSGATEEARAQELVRETRRRARIGRGTVEGMLFGALAGVCYATVEMLTATMMGRSALQPFRRFASVLIGPSALDHARPGTSVVVGIVVHLTLSASFGLVFGLFRARLMPNGRRTMGSGFEIGLGLLYGALLWLVNYQLLARIWYPWLLDVPQLLELVLHAVFFGGALALLRGMFERGRVVELPL